MEAHSVTVLGLYLQQWQLCLYVLYYYDEVVVVVVESKNDYGTEPQLYKYEFYKFDLNI